LAVEEIQVQVFPAGLSSNEDLKLGFSGEDVIDGRGDNFRGSGDRSAGFHELTHDGFLLMRTEAADEPESVAGLVPDARAGESRFFRVT
jgi:hypothetical protein